MRAALFLIALVCAGFVLTTDAHAAQERALDIAADNMTGSHGPEGDIVLLSGNVHITRGRTVLTGDQGRYLREQGLLYLEGNVRMVDSTTVITCEQASYSEDEDIVHLQGHVVLEDNKAVLRAPYALYDRTLGQANLWGGVDGQDGDQHITCDRATYDRDLEVLHARGGVKAVDKKNRLELAARSVDYDRITHEALAVEEPSLTARDENGRKTVVHADTLRFNTESRVAEAIDSVRVESDTLKASGRYALFDDEAGRGWLFGNPRAWDGQTTVTGDTLELWTEDRVLERAIVRGNAVMDYVGNTEVTRGERSRLSGNRFDVYFTDQDIDSLVAFGSARNEYQAAAPSEGTPERNVALGDTITLFFNDRAIDRARVNGSASGEYHFSVAEGDTAAEDQEVVQYDAKQIDYMVPEKKIVLELGSHLVYQDLELNSSKVTFDVDRQTLVASGKPDLVEHGDRVEGKIMTYDLESRVGNIYGAETTYEQGFYHGKRIRKGTENELDVQNGLYTTCDLPEPHYHFASRWMKIYLKDKVVAKPVVFYIKNVPLLAFPFWVFPIKPGRHSGLLLPQVELGFANPGGQFIRNAGYYWAPNDYMDLTVSGDYYQAEPSWVIRGESQYKLLYVLDGTMNGSFARNEGQNTDNWDFNATHTQEITPRTRLIGRASFISSRDYNSSNLYGRSLSQRLNRFLTSNIALSHSASWATFNSVLDRRQDLDADAAIADPDGQGPLQGPPPGTYATLANLTERFPNLTVSFPTRTIGGLPMLKGTALEKPLSSMYFGLNAQFQSQLERRAYVSGYQYFVRDTTLDSTTTIGQQITTRRGFQASSSLSDARRAFGWLNLRPSISGTMAIFDFDELGHKVVPTGVWSTALTTSSTFYGTFHPKIWRLEGIRHVLFPSASFTYSPEFPNLFYVDANGIKQPRFRSFSGIGVSGAKQFRMDFGLDQRFQVKYRRGDEVVRLDNLMSWSTAGSYNFLYKEQGQQHPLTPLSSNVVLQPPGVVSASFSWVTDVYRARPLRTFSFNTGLDLSSAGHASTTPSLPVEESTNQFNEEEPTEAWSLGLAYSYAGGREALDRWSSSQTANAVAHVQLTPGWTLDYSASYDVTAHQLGTQRFALTRDLHCWQAIFTRTFAPDGETEYYFRLGVKNQKEIYIERGTRSGSIGGIQ